MQGIEDPRVGIRFPYRPLQTDTRLGMPPMWDLLGFSESPYDTRPLSPIEADAQMLVARERETTALLTVLDSRRDGVVILSGAPGVGKTSFLNVNQYRLATGQSLFGPRILPAYFLTPVNPGDTPENVAKRVVQNLVKSVEQYCAQTDKAIPPQARIIRKWVSAHGASGFDIGLQIFGFGGNIARDTEIPALSDASFDRLQEVISALVSEAIKELGVDSVAIVMDNLENLDNEELKALLMTFRDTLFSAPSAWWVLIGQSGLGSLVRELDPRVADRIEGTGIELEPISLDQLHEAVRLRIERFSNRDGAKPPIPHAIHRLLYDASNKEIRFVFKYANTICTRYIAQMRDRATRFLEENREKYPNVTRADVDEVVGDLLVTDPLEKRQAEALLKAVAVDELRQTALSRKELEVLQKIGERESARGKDHDLFGVKSNQQFSSRFLVPLRQRQLLARTQEGAGVIYTLRGLAALAYQYGLLSSGATPTAVKEEDETGED